MVAENLWGPIEGGVRAAFGQQINQSASRLVDSLDCGARYLDIDHQRRLLLFTRHAFLYGVLQHGFRGKTSDLPDEADIWLADWFRRSNLLRIADESVLPTGNDAAITDAVAKEYRITLAPTMGRLVEIARGYASATTGRPTAELRHLVAALMLNEEDWPQQLGRKPNPAQIAEGLELLVSQLNGRPGIDDNVSAWFSLLPRGNPNMQAAPAFESVVGPSADSGTTPTVTPTVSEAVGSAAGTSKAEAAATVPDDRIPLSGFSTDRPDRVMPGDPLGIAQDVQAFARLVAARDTALPLSIGIFGDWGTGKSTFMDALEKAIDLLTRPNQPHFVDRVIHIRFNAWQYADANLWASLTAEFFEQLRVGGHAEQHRERYDRLVERVNTHVHALSENAAAARDALADSKKELADAQKDRDQAVREVHRAQSGVLMQSVLDAAGAAFEKHREELADLLDIAEDRDEGQALSDFLDVAKAVRGTGGQLKIIGAATFKGGWRKRLAILAILVPLLFLLGLGIDWFFEGVDRPASILSRFGGWTAIAGLGTLIAAATPAIKMVAGIVKSTASFARRLDEISSESQKKVLQSDIRLRAAVREAKARQEAVDRAGKALARYVGPEENQPPRLLRYVLEDFPDTKEMEKEIGLITRARRLFESVDAIVRQERQRRDEGQPADVDVPDRIILYIDDLDRCTSDQVYAVLQAIHLLLAFELFVVVVGVDVHWIEEALGKQRGLPDLPEGLSEEAARRSLDTARRVNAIRYLEKIFQLPFWLRPLTTEGDDGGSYGRYVRALTTPVSSSVAPAGRISVDANDRSASLPADATTDQAVGPPPMPGANVVPKHADSRAADNGSPEAAVSAEATRDNFIAMALGSGEVDFLANPLIGNLAAKDPRAVKRLVNVYRILRASLTLAQRRVFLGEDGSLPHYQLAILLIAIDVGQPLKVADALYQGLRRRGTNGEFDLAQVMRESQRAPEDLKDNPLAVAFREEPALAYAWAEVDKRRGTATIPFSICLHLAQAIRRYSFNKY